jgi:hypothetical protein
MSTDAALPPGRHDVILVDARWRTGDVGTAPSAIDVDCAFTAGERKGAVVTVPLDVGSPAYGQLLALLGRVDAVAGADDVETAALAFPCTLVVTIGDDGPGGGFGVAFDD